MNHETRKLIDKVEETTGYKVSIGSGTVFSGYAQMISATENNPIHVINVNRKYSNIGDYVVAIQCAMILIKWADHSRVPLFVENTDKIAYRIDKVSKNGKLANISPDAARQYASLIVKGLLHQLLSISAEMLALNRYLLNAPGLKDMMITVIRNEIQEAHQSLAPKIKEITPEDIFNKSAAINAAFALNWSRISGDDHILVPFMAVDQLDNGKALMNIYDDLPEIDNQKYTKLIDGWAQALELNSYYNWEFTGK
jgi:hypothetical protein